ncbi:hypothetical protein [Microcoleus sp. Pol7_A1]
MPATARFKATICIIIGVYFEGALALQADAIDSICEGCVKAG